MHFVADGTQDVYAPAGASAPTPNTGNLRQTAETPDSGGNRDVLETDSRESPKAKPEELTTAHSAHDDAGIDQSTTTASGNLIDFGYYACCFMLHTVHICIHAIYISHSFSCDLVSIILGFL